MQKSVATAKQILKMTGDFLSTFLVTLIALVAVIFVLARLLGWNLFSVDSSSMEPRYSLDALLFVKEVKPEEIQLQDVVTYVFNEDGVLVTHRVVGIDTARRTFTTKGDANNSADAIAVPWSNVVGKVSFCIPGLGKPLRFLTDSENRPIVLTVVAVLFLFSLVWDLNERKRRKGQTSKIDSGAEPNRQAETQASS